SGPTAALSPLHWGDSSMIHNDEEAADLVRGIDKHSGGWAKVDSLTVKVGKPRTETWSALLSRSIAGIYVSYARKRGGRRLTGDDIPKHVLEYLCCFERSLCKS